MKSKKGAFANSSTGYNKRHNTNSYKSANKSTKPAETSNNKKPKHAERDGEKPKLDDQENYLNSGFGNYLRSSEGIEMMKIFVFANTVMVIVTMAWPHFKAQCYWLFEWWESFRLETN